MRLVLASASPRRASLLAAAGFSFETIAVGLDERARPSEAPAEYVVRLATEKAALGFEAIRHGDRGLSKGATGDGDARTEAPGEIASDTVMRARSVTSRPPQSHGSR